MSCRYSEHPSLETLREEAYAMLKPKRIPHVAGCEREAVRLAEKYGVDTYDAAFAAILHDCTKRLSYEEQLNFCEKYGILLDEDERNMPPILHARTGAAAARELFGVPEALENAIRWHTTGHPGMTELEKIIYLADCIEETRSFPGVDTVRAAAEQSLNQAMACMLSLSLADIRARRQEPYRDTVEAEEYYQGGKET